MRCGLSTTPNDARIYIKKYVNYITPSKGGNGALRDFADLILDNFGYLDEIIEKQIEGIK